MSKRNKSHILLTYHVDILVLLTGTKPYTPKPNCELFRKSFMYSGAAYVILSPYMLKMQLRLTLLNLYI